MVALLDCPESQFRNRFSKVISLGNKAGVTETELMEYLVKILKLQLLLSYLESISDDDNFIVAMRKTTAKKPIAVL